MSWQIPQQQKHKVFLSYYHYADQGYKNAFEAAYGNLFINKSVGAGDIKTDLSTEYIKHLIQDGYLGDTSVIVVFCGPLTYGRKHVDWEISAAISQKVGGRSGLVGILLPEFPLLTNGNYLVEKLPPRLADNVNSGYATVYTWNWITSHRQRVIDAIENAHTNRVSLAAKADNSRQQMQRNTSGI
jgi:hypothetical protein